MVVVDYNQLYILIYFLIKKGNNDVKIENIKYKFYFYNCNLFIIYIVFLSSYFELF